MENININLKEAYNAIKNILETKCILKGSFIFFHAILKYDVKINRNVKDLDITLLSQWNKPDYNEIINNIFGKIRALNPNSRIEYNSNTGVNTIKQRKNKIWSTLIDIAPVKSIDYEHYKIEGSLVRGSSVYQMVADKLKVCASANYYRVAKDLEDLYNLIKHFNINLLDLWDVIYLNNYNEVQFEYLFSNVKNIRASLLYEDKFESAEKLNLIREQIFKDFINQLRESHKLYRTFKLHYEKKSILQREYTPIYERYNNIAGLNKDEYDKFWFLSDNKDVKVEDSSDYIVNWEGN